MLGFCDRCGQRSENTSIHCMRIIEPVPASSGANSAHSFTEGSEVESSPPSREEETAEYFLDAQGYVKSMYIGEKTVEPQFQRITVIRLMEEYAFKKILSAELEIKELKEELARWESGERNTEQ